VAANLEAMNPTRTLAVIGVVMLALAGCGGTGRGTSANPSQSSSPSTEDARVAWFDVVKCLREHGFPDFPDPVQNERGGWELAADLNTEVPAECSQVVIRAKQATRALNAPTAQEMENLRRFARCVREHGVPNFPDPDDQGNFDLPEGMKDDALREAQTACRQYAPPQRPK
jgi:hypothetical protein